jgi:hypothetical protein
LLSQKVAREMLSPGLQSHGLGPIISDDGLRFGHDGANAGFRSAMTGFIDGRGGIVVMSNGDNGEVLNAEIVATLGKLIAWPGMKPLERAVADVPLDAIDRLTGRYRTRQLDGTPVDVELTRRGAMLEITFNGRRARTLSPESSSRFFDRDDGYQVDFVSDGTVMRMVDLVGGGTGVRQ